MGKKSLLQKKRAEVYRIESQIQRLRMQERKQDTREKIQLGGLIVKAGLRDEDKAVVLGILLDAAAKIWDDSGKDLKEHYREIGDTAFKKGTDHE